MIWFFIFFLYPILFLFLWFCFFPLFFFSWFCSPPFFFFLFSFSLLILFSFTRKIHGVKCWNFSNPPSPLLFSLLVGTLFPFYLFGISFSVPDSFFFFLSFFFFFCSLALKIYESSTLNRIYKIKHWNHEMMVIFEKITKLH